MNHTRDERLLIKFGAHLKQLRKKKELSIRKLSDAAEVDFSQIHRIEKGEANPTYTMLLALANGLGISLQELITID